MPVALIKRRPLRGHSCFQSRPIILTHLLLPDDAQFKKAAGRFAAVVVPKLTLLMPAVAPIQKGGRFADVFVQKRLILYSCYSPIADRLILYWCQLHQLPPLLKVGRKAETGTERKQVQNVFIFWFLIINSTSLNQLVADLFNSTSLNQLNWRGGGSWSLH